MTTGPTDSEITETADAAGIKSGALFGAILTPGGSSETVEWATPQEMYDRYNAEFGFTLDPCCTHENAKCSKHYTRTENGLVQNWSGDRVWMNPPYGREIGAWMRKAYEESQRGALVVCLIPARTDTAWWHDYAMKGEVRFIRRRVRFAGHKGYAPFPSAVVIFSQNTQDPACGTSSD